MKADELWRKYRLPAPAVEEMTIHLFRAALKEYGELVKAEAVKVLEDNWYKTQLDCAAAISKMELP